MSTFRQFSLCAAMAAIATVAGCATWSTSNVEAGNASAPASSAPAAAKKTASEVRITDGDIADRKYASLGDITVTVNKTTVFHSDPTRDMVNEKLREKAAELGADAVIFVRYGTGGVSLLSWGSLEGKGRAIRFAR